LLSIAICTYRRADQLQILLAQWAQLLPQAPEVTELLVVNNGVDPRTSEVLASYNSIEKLREVTETELGLANARNRALAEFTADAIWFLDDDTTLFSPAALHAYISALDAYPNADYFGGPIQVDWQDQPPHWLRDEKLPVLNGLFGHYDLGGQDRDYDDSVLGPYGANFVLRRRLVDHVGWFDTRLGVKGAEIGRGEETDLFQRAKRAGARGKYVAEALVGHRFQHERLNLTYLWQYGLAKGREAATNPAQNHARPKWWFRRFLNQWLRGVAQLLRGRRDRFYQCWINMGVARGRHVAQTKQGFN